MFVFFKIRNTSFDVNKPQEKIAGLIVTKVLRFQENWAAFMKRKTEKLPVRSMKLWLIAFSFFTGTLSICLIITSVNQSNHFFKIQQIPKSPNITGNGNGFTIQPFIQNGELERIKKFKTSFDSLGNSVEGRKIREQILANRPGLLDSILQLEQLILLQQSLKK